MVTAVGKGFVVTEVSYGLGQHRSEVPIEHYRNFLKYYYLDTVQFFIALATCKISICLFLLRLSQFNKMRAVLYGLIGFLVFTTVVLDLLYALQCQPVHKVWDVETPGKCFSANLVMNINIVQGGEFALLKYLRTCLALNPSSILLHNRLHLRRLPHRSPPQPQRLKPTQIRPLHSHEPRRDHWRRSHRPRSHRQRRQSLRFIMGLNRAFHDADLRGQYRQHRSLCTIIQTFWPMGTRKGLRPGSTGIVLSERE